MNSCSRCGSKLQHNYLKKVFRTLHDKRELVLVCLKCLEIVKAQEAQQPKGKEKNQAAAAETLVPAPKAPQHKKENQGGASQGRPTAKK